MNIQLPKHLEETSELLKGSLRHHSSEKAPHLPGELLHDLSARFTVSQASQPARHESVSIFSKLQHLISRPAFGMAAAAAVILTLVSPALLNSTGGETFRGAATTEPNVDETRIVLIGAPTSTADFLMNSGDFEKDVFSILSAPSTQDRGSKVVADFNSGTIQAIDAQGAEIFSETLPTGDSAISQAIARALSEL